jgi:hypothetical protein
VSERESLCVCGHLVGSHSLMLGRNRGCRRCDCQSFIDATCTCGEINARHCPVHNEANS